MDYQFIRNEYNEPEAIFSGNHLAMGNFFTSELASNTRLIHDIRAAILRLEINKTDSFEWLGKEYKLAIEHKEVSVTALVLDHDVYDELPESTQLYDKEQKSGCGLSDFSDVIDDWLSYIST